jgi:hypothetical protein
MSPLDFKNLETVSSATILKIRLGCSLWIYRVTTRNTNYSAFQWEVEAICPTFCHILSSHGMIADRAISCDVTVYSLTAFQPLTEERILSFTVGA